MCSRARRSWLSSIVRNTSIVAAIRIGISTDLDFEYRATDPRGSALPDQPEDLFHCPGLLPDARLTLIVSQPV
jgi:hypothetical protein